MIPDTFETETLIAMLQILGTLAGFVVLFFRVQWQGQQNAAAIAELKKQVTDDHKALALALKEARDEISRDIGTLFAKHSETAGKLEGVDATVKNGITPRLSKVEDDLSIQARAQLGMSEALSKRAGNGG